MSLKALALLLRDEKTISAYEVHTSRLVPILLHCLTGGGGGKGGAMGGEGGKGGGDVDVGRGGKMVGGRVEVFKKMFSESAEQLPPDLDTR